MMKIKNQTITGGSQQFADKIVNQNKNITAGNYVAGNVTGGNLAGGDIHITNNNSPIDNPAKPQPKTILIAAASPSDEARLRLDIEVRDIEEGLRLTQQRDRFVLEKIWATRVRDLRRAMQTYEPTIVHFCGHGTGENGIILEDNQGQAQLVSSEALAGFFELFDNVECVVLNACYSEVQAQAIVQSIPNVIGMSKAIGDKAAIEFAVAFYDSLAAGETYDRAYKFACNAIAMAGISGHFIPQLLKNER